jgi:hypothetical protein
MALVKETPDIFYPLSKIRALMMCSRNSQGIFFKIGNVKNHAACIGNPLLVMLF